MDAVCGVWLQWCPWRDLSADWSLGWRRKTFWIDASYLLCMWLDADWWHVCLPLRSVSILHNSSHTYPNLEAHLPTTWLHNVHPIVLTAGNVLLTVQVRADGTFDVPSPLELITELWVPARSWKGQDWLHFSHISHWQYSIRSHWVLGLGRL